MKSGRSYVARASAGDMRRWPLVAAAVLTIACQAAPPPTPPADSFTARTWSLKVGEDTVSVDGAVVTPSFFMDGKLLPLIGRLFTEADWAGGQGIPDVALLGHELWTARFGAAPNLIGRAIEIDGRPVTVVGIMPRGFAVPDRAQIWMPR
jgi:hypothetical protein